MERAGCRVCETPTEERDQVCVTCRAWERRLFGDQSPLWEIKYLDGRLHPCEDCSAPFVHTISNGLDWLCGPCSRSWERGVQTDSDLKWWLIIARNRLHMARRRHAARLRRVGVAS